MVHVWIFVYGSLMCDYKQYRPQHIKNAVLWGFERKFNKPSTERVGTKKQPGLALGITKGKKCIGKVIYVDEKEHSKIKKREGGYEEATTLDITNMDGTKIPGCIVYVPEKPTNYDLEKQAEIITQSKGEITNLDYFQDVYNTLKKADIKDGYIELLNLKIKKLLM